MQNNDFYLKFARTYQVNINPIFDKKHKVLFDTSHPFIWFKMINQLSLYA